MMPSFASLFLRNQFQKQRPASCISRSFATSAKKRAAKRQAINKHIAAATAESKPVQSRPVLTKKKAIDVKNIPKAPHMAKDALKSKGVLDKLKEAPFIPMVVIFPSLMMGLALIIRPDLREQVFGSKKVKKAIPMDLDSDKPANEKVVLDEVQKVATEGAQGHQSTVFRSASAEETPTTPKSSAEDIKGEVRDLIYEMGFRPHPSA
jgi:hypothetical protein